MRETERATIGRSDVCRDTEFASSEDTANLYATFRTAFSVSMVRSTSDARHGLPK